MSERRKEEKEEKEEKEGRRKFGPKVGGCGFFFIPADKMDTASM